MGTQAGIYVRISQDRGGAGLGVQRQEADCRALCERKGWTVAEVYVDDDVSAYSGKPRPAWQRLRQDVEAGAVDGIAIWHVDRLTRTPRELEDVIGYAEKHGLELATVAGDVDLATPTGRMVARMLGAAARHESEHKAERQRRERRQSAERGRVAGGGIRPYGYADDRVTVLDDEAAVIRECAKRVLAGESLSSLCRDLFVRGVVTPTGRHFTPTKLRCVLASARISGRREHTPRDSYTGSRPLLGEIVADAVWPGIISHDDNDRLRTILSRPERRKNTTANGRTYLLSGILRCAICKGGMVGRPKNGTPRYVCPNTPGGNTCGRMASVAVRTDDFIRDMALVALDSPKMRAALTRQEPANPAVDEAIRKDEDALADLIADKDDSIISRGEYLSRRMAIETRLTVNAAKRARATHVEPLADFVGTYDEMLARWKSRNTSQRRAIIEAVLVKVTVSSADPRKKWDPDRFDPIWRV